MVCCTCWAHRGASLSFHNIMKCKMFWFVQFQRKNNMKSNNLNVRFAPGPWSQRYQKNPFHQLHQYNRSVIIKLLDATWTWKSLWTGLSTDARLFRPECWKNTGKMYLCAKCAEFGRLVNLPIRMFFPKDGKPRITFLLTKGFHASSFVSLAFEDKLAYFCCFTAASPAEQEHNPVCTVLPTYKGSTCRAALVCLQFSTSNK